MRRYVWIGLCSALVHLALFWPGPDMTRDGQLPTLLVKLPDVAESKRSNDLRDSVDPEPINPPVPERQDGVPQKAVSAQEARAMPAKSDTGRRDVPVQTEGAPSSSVDHDQLPAPANAPDGPFAWARYRIALASAAVMRVRTELTPQVMLDDAGTVMVEIRGLQGGPTKARVVGSSGHSGLDEAVRRALERALGDLPTPQPEQGAEWSFRLPVHVSRESED